MKKRKLYLNLMIFCLLFPGMTASVHAQSEGKILSRKERKAIEQQIAFAYVDSLVSSRKFSFEPMFSTGLAETFVLLDSIYGEVQNGNRNNLTGEITKFEVNRNFKKSNMSVEILMRGVFNTATVVLFIGAYGEGTAKVSGEFPETFSFSGKLVDLDHASVYSGPDHFVR